MKNDFELVSKYDDISTSEKPKIPNYHKDMFIDVEQEYLMRKELQQRINKAIEYCEEIKSRAIDIDDTDFDLGEDFTARRLLDILKGSEE